MVNHSMIIGNVGAAPEIHVFNDGNKVATLRVCTSEKYRDRNGELQSIDTWHTVKVYGRSAEFVEQYITKGRLVYVAGARRTESWEKDGQKHYRDYLKASEIKPLSRGDQAQSNGSRATASSAPAMAANNGGFQDESWDPPF